MRSLVRHIDCRIGLKSVKDGSVDMVATDPPYFLDGLDNDWKKGGKKQAGVVGGLPVGMKFDVRQGLKLQEFMQAVSGTLIAKMKPGAVACVCSQPRLSHRMSVGMEEAGFEIRDMAAWHFKQSQFKAFSMDHFVRKMSITAGEKERLMNEMKNRKTLQLRPVFEVVIVAQKPKIGTYVDNWLAYRTGLMDASVDNTTTLMEYEKPKKDSFNTHMTVKPVGLMQHLIELFSLPGQRVLDPFCGSGTTGVAAKITGRNFLGFEICKEYVEIAKWRIRETTGKGD